MIKANELRIGNIIRESNSFTSTPEDLEEIIVGSIDAINKVVRDDQENGYSYDALYPIPISVAWMERMGFDTKETVIMVYEDETRYSLRIHKLEVTFTVAYVRDTSGADITRIRIRLDGDLIYVPKAIVHVHQLQNLYFALTGEELTIKN